MINKLQITLKKKKKGSGLGIIWVRAAIPCLAERHCVSLQLLRSCWLPAHKFAVVLSLLSNLLLWKRSYPSGSEIILQWDEAHSKQQKHNVTLQPLSALTVAFVLTFLDLEILTKSIRSVFLRKHETEFKIHILVKTDTLHLTSIASVLFPGIFWSTSWGLWSLWWRKTYSLWVSQC